MEQVKDRSKLFWLIHVIGWGIMFGFPLFFATREGNAITWRWFLGYAFGTAGFYDCFLYELFLADPAGFVS